MKLALWWVLLISINHVVLANRVILSHPGRTFVHSSQEPKYKIEFHSEDSPFVPEDSQESVVMPSKNRDKFLCFLPKVEKSKTRKLHQQNTSGLIVETGKEIKLKTPDELLEQLKDQCFLRQEGWWWYEFCYQKKLRQLHMEDGKVIQEFILGVYDAEATDIYNQNLVSETATLKDPRSKDASRRYHAHQYINGTACDLTNGPRETEVRFVCAGTRAMISSITELSTCKYALTLQSPILCKHPSFEEERPSWETIHCNELPKEKKFEDDEHHITFLTNTQYPSTSMF